MFVISVSVHASAYVTSLYALLVIKVTVLMTPRKGYEKVHGKVFEFNWQVSAETLPGVIESNIHSVV